MGGKCHSKSGRYELIRGKSRCAAKLQCLLGQLQGKLAILLCAGGGLGRTTLNLGSVSRFEKHGAFVGAIWAKLADPAVVLVVGWVALECQSQPGRYEQI